MIESLIISELKNDMTLVGLLSTHATGEPSIFTSRAPQGTPFPYVVVWLNRTREDQVMHIFDLHIDLFDDQNSTGIEAREACERIEYIFDNKRLTHARYSNIRFYSTSWNSLEEVDPRSTHYSNIFNVRAIRKKWINDNT